MDKLYIIIPAYNEQDNIRSTIAQWHPLVEGIGPESRLVIIDDGSRDGTYQIASDLRSIYPQLTVLTKENQGHGPTVLRGYKYAIRHGADYVFQTDSDGQTLPGEFWKFWERRADYAMVIGHRKGRQDGASRVFVTKVLKLVCRICFNVTVTDANTPFRLMQAEPLAENIKLVPEKFNLSNVILSVIYAKKKQNVLYLPITFRPRQGGVNSINLKKIFKIGKKAFHDFRTINRCLKDVEVKKESR